jgi:t-SNARE complex subunit (syntaxin)
MDVNNEDDLVSDYKKLELEMNKIIHSHTNSRAFMLAFGQEMESHLKRAKIRKRLVTRWLSRLDLMNKDEIAAISIKIVDCEEKIDTMDDTVYKTNQMMKESQRQLRKVWESWNEWLTFLKIEVQEIREKKINLFEKELLELKQLFNDMEDDEND